VLYRITYEILFEKGKAVVEADSKDKAEREFFEWRPDVLEAVLTGVGRTEVEEVKTDVCRQTLKRELLPFSKPNRQEGFNPLRDLNPEEVSKGVVETLNSIRKADKREKNNGKNSQKSIHRL